MSLPEANIQIAIFERRLRELLSYDPETGQFTYLQPGPNRRVGKVAGCVDRDQGYRHVYVDSMRVKAHRLAWFFVHGEWPSGPLDHRDGDRDNNRISNLRVATNSQNMANRKRNAKSATGIKGVRYDKRCRRWVARIQVNGVRSEIGYFETPEAAQQAYELAARRAFGEFARVS